MCSERNFQKFIDLREASLHSSTFIKNCVNFCEKWSLVSPDDCINDIKCNERKLLRETMKCVIYGRVSTGKSALINSLLGQNILPSHNGPTTNNFVEIRKSEDITTYVVFPNTEGKREDVTFINRVDRIGPDSLQECSRVKLYISSSQYPSFMENVVMVDTPGIDTGKEMDSLIRDECKDADVLILIFSCQSGPSISEKEFLKKYKSIFSIVKFIVLFNFADEISEEYKQIYTDDIKQYLREELQINTNNNENIFFISARERLQIKCNTENRFSEGWEDRNSNYDNFTNYLQEIFCERKDSEIEKRHLEILSSTYCLMKQHKENLWKKMNQNLSNLSNLNEQMKKEVAIIFKNMYEIYFSFGLKIVRKNKDQGDTLIEERLKAYIHEIMIVITESLRNTLKEMFAEYKNEENSSNITNEEETYCPVNFNLLDGIEAGDITKFKESFMEIIRIRYNYKIITIAGGATAGAAALAVVGVTGGIIVPIATEIAATVFAITGVAVGGGIGGMSAFFTAKIRRFKRIAYKPRYEEQEKVIAELWKKMETFSMQIYVSEIPKITSELMKYIDEEFYKYEKIMNDISKKWNEPLNDIIVH